MSEQNECIDVNDDVLERFEEARKKTETPHAPAMDQGTFLSSLLDTQEAVKSGYYND